LIDINQYLPFTRKGSLVINGDRRIKKNTFVRLKSTGEIFYVDNVTNLYSTSGTEIDRETTLAISRGMIERYVMGDIIKKGSKDKFTYWDIIDTELIRSVLSIKLNQLSSEETTGKEDLRTVTKSNFGVNLEVFDFFLKRKQLTKI
jgi:hypothetical protein